MRLWLTFKHSIILQLKRRSKGRSILCGTNDFNSHLRICPYFIQKLIEIEFEVLGIVPQIATCLNRRRHGRKIIRFQRLQVWNTDANVFENLFERKAFFFARVFEFLTDGLSHEKRNNPVGRQCDRASKRNITSSPSNGNELVMSWADGFVLSFGLFCCLRRRFNLGFSGC